MPYIKKKERAKYDSVIDELAEILYSLDNNVLIGDMNYVIFRLAGLVCTHADKSIVSYARMAVVSSAMSEAQSEFRRRIMALYEDDKIKENGDVEL